MTRQPRQAGLTDFMLDGTRAVNALSQSYIRFGSYVDDYVGIRMLLRILMHT